MSRDGFNRRVFLKGVGLLTGGAVIGSPSWAEDKWKRAEVTQELLETFYHETEVRPTYAWMNREDVLYHDMDMPPAIAETVEYCGLLREAVWVFNRTTQWVRTPGNILCYDAAGTLSLTGDDQASAWHTGAQNRLEHQGRYAVFTRGSGRRGDGAIIPSFQFRLAQHPVLTVEMAEANCDWQVCITPKGRGGIPLIASAWQSGAGTIDVDIAAELGRRGFDWMYPELHIVIGTWTDDPARAARLKFDAHFAGRPALAACLPVIRTRTRAAEGVLVTAVLLDGGGRRVGAGAARVSASVAGQSVTLEEAEGVWSARLRGLPAGDHTVLLQASGAVDAQTHCEVRITDQEFLRFDRSQRWVERGGVPLGPLSGSYQGTFFFKHAGEPGERMIQGQPAWDAWDRSAPDSEHMHFWESLSEDELDQRFRFLAESGFDMTALHSHWGDWERLDAGGRIAPHGAEQLARYLRVASRHGLRHVQALASGPYGTTSQRPDYGGTLPYSVYLDAGFQTAQFMTPGTASFDDLYHRYLDDVATLFADETAIFAFTSAGEGDHYVGPARTNDTERRIRAQDRNHAFLAETVLIMKKLPREHSKGFEQDRFGSRTYFIGTHHVPESDLGVHFKFLSMDGLYLAEGSWPPMPEYVRFQTEVLKNDKASPRCWTGTEHFRRRLRDTLWLGMVHLLPIINTWDEEFTEDEHRLFREVRALIDWRLSFAASRVVIWVDDQAADVDQARYGDLVRIETALARLGITSRFIARTDPRPGDADWVIDPALPLPDLRYRSQGGAIPDVVRTALPLETSAGYSSSHVRSADGHTCLAYLYNTTRHEREYYWLGGNRHRSPVAVPLTVELRAAKSAAGHFRLYDLDTRQLIDAGSLRGAKPVELGATSHDYVVLITPG